MDGPKIKDDITNLVKAGKTYMTKDEIQRLTDDVKKIRVEIADNGYEVQNSKDLTLKIEKKIESNHKEVKASIMTIREKSQNNEANANAYKKSLQVLDDRLKAFIKNAQLSGNTAVGEGNVVQEIEDSILQIRTDFDEYKKMNSSEQRMLKNDLYNKATKQENIELEKRVEGQAEEMFGKLKDIFPDKDLMQRKLNRLDRQIR